MRGVCGGRQGLVGARRYWVALSCLLSKEFLVKLILLCLSRQQSSRLDTALLDIDLLGTFLARSGLPKLMRHIYQCLRSRSPGVNWCHIAWRNHAAAALRSIPAAHGLQGGLRDASLPYHGFDVLHGLAHLRGARPEERLRALRPLAQNARARLLCLPHLAPIPVQVGIHPAEQGLGVLSRRGRVHGRRVGGRWGGPLLGRDLGLNPREAVKGGAWVAVWPVAGAEDEIHLFLFADEPIPVPLLYDEMWISTSREEMGLNAREGHSVKMREGRYIRSPSPSKHSDLPSAGCWVCKPESAIAFPPLGSGI